MIIKRKKKIYINILSIFIVIILSLLAINKEQLPIIKADAIQYIMGMDLGFSHKVALVDSGEGIFQNGMDEGISEYRKQILPSIFKSIPKIIKYKMNSQAIERIDIDIKYVDYKKITRDRDRALKRGLLSNPETVKVEIRFQGKVYKAKIRLKGDTIAHWGSLNRMSFRVNLKGNNTILGYKKFSIQKPSSRHHPYDYAFQSMMRQLGNLSATHNFVHVYVNGKDWGVMDVEEHMSKRFLEKQDRKESAIVRFSNERYWLYSYNSKYPYTKYRLSSPSLYLHLYGSKKYLKNNRYRRIYSYIMKHNVNYEPALYDIDQLTKAYILSTAWGDWHTLGSNNTRYYFNPYTLKLEPITTDQSGYSPLKDRESIPFFNYLPPQFTNVMLDQQYSRNLSNNLSAVQNTVLGINKHLNEPAHFFPVDRKKNGSTVINNMNKIMSDNDEYLAYRPLNLYHIPRAGPVNEEDLTRQDGISKLTLPTNLQASEFNELLHIRHFTDGRIELYSLLPDDILVKDILFKGESFNDEDFIVPSYLSDSDPLILHTQYLGVQDDNFTFKTEYMGFSSEMKNGISLTEDKIHNPLLLDTVLSENILKRLDNGDYEFNKGSWIVNKPLIINGDLRIPPGVNIKFSKDAYLIVKGALIAEGNIDKPILLEPVTDSWKGIYILNANKRSRLTNVVIKNVRGLKDGLLELSGGITFYKSDVDFTDVEIEGVEAEDAINIVKSDFSMKFVRINNTVSDGFDSDFSHGIVSKSIFSNIGGDALDFSGSNIKIEGVEAIHVKDKAISGGEKSIININNSSFKDVGVGVASKDGSNILVANTSILDYRLHAAMSYIKKDFYDITTSIELVNCKIDQGEPYIRQKGTKMIVNNSEIPEIEVNVRELYKSTVMKK
ncbi:hypothetical protein HOO14_05440 [bacterium]|jgi:hypothetical protein|nr:hypothetical protein [bacterium]